MLVFVTAVICYLKPEEVHFVLILQVYFYCSTWNTENRLHHFRIVGFHFNKRYLGYRHTMECLCINDILLFEGGVISLFSFQEYTKYTLISRQPSSLFVFLGLIVRWNILMLCVLFTRHFLDYSWILT